MGVSSHHVVVAVVVEVVVAVVKDVDGRVASFATMEWLLPWMDVVLEVSVARRSCRCCRGGRCQGSNWIWRSAHHH